MLIHGKMLATVQLFVALIVGLVWTDALGFGLVLQRVPLLVLGPSGEELGLVAASHALGQHNSLKELRWSQIGNPIVQY